ncbi:uncharacterized [Tachysurus ichikawai]
MQASRLHANPSSWLNSFHRGDAFSGSDFCVAALQQAFKASTDSLLMMNQHFWKGGVLAERDSWMPFLNPSHAVTTSRSYPSSPPFPQAGLLVLNPAKGSAPALSSSAEPSIETQAQFHTDPID